MILRMIDRYNRKINYLRVSVTQRCNLNCRYCGAVPEGKNQELTPAEIEKIVSAFVYHGIDKVRLTGGEPLVRDDICEIAERIGRLQGVKKLALTTNGIRLSETAQKLKNAGVTAVNISLDTTDKEQFRNITGHDSLHKVFEGIDACERVGISALRLNAVLIRGENDSSAKSLIEIARDRKIDVRFIELMPFSDEGENDKLVIKGEEILQKFPFLKPVDMNKSGFESSVARYYEAEGFKGRIGLITPVSKKFCRDCNRIRLLSDGRVKPCLGNNETYDLKQYIDDEEKLRHAVADAILSKPMEHSFLCGYGNSHGMNRIGG